MVLNDIHQQLSHEIGNEIACALRIDWIVRILQNQITNGNVASYQYPTTDNLVHAGLTFDMNQFQLIQNGAKIEMRGFRPIVHLKEPNAPNADYNSISLEYPPIQLSLNIQNNLPKLEIDNYQINPPVNHPGIPNLQVIQQNGMTENQYLIKQQAIIYQSLYMEILQQFVDSMKVPDALPAMTLFKLSPPFKYFYLDEYIVVTGLVQTKFDENCECRHDSIDRRLQRNQNGADVNGRTLTYPGRQDVVNMNNPAIVYYFPRQSFNLLGDSIIKPAIYAGDKGRVLMFQWYYNVAASLNSFNLTLDPAQNQIIIDTTHTIFGDAGVSLKVGCIYQNLVSAELHGDVDQSHLELKISQDAGNNVMLHGNYRFHLDVDLNFLFGLDIILNIILDSILDKLVKDKYEGKLKLFNNKLIDLNAIQPSSRYGWLLSKSSSANSFVIGVDAANDHWNGGD